MLTLRQTKQHYLRPEIRKTILRVSTDGNYSRSGHWQDTKNVNGVEKEIQDWYRRIEGKQFKYEMSSPVDYNNMVLNHRTIYWTLNYFDKGIYKLNYSGISSEQSPGISRQHTVAYSLGIDIDKEHGKDIHDPDVKKAVEDMGQFFSDFLREYLPNSVYCLYSGGGIYLLIHHRTLDQYYNKYLRRTDPAYSWDYMFRVLGDAFDGLIKTKENEFFVMRPEHKGKVKADALNNSQRVFKTIFSIHKKLDYAVIPLDPYDMEIDFDKAKLPICEEVIEDGNNWYTDYDDGGYFLVNCLKPYLEAAIKKKGKDIAYDSECYCSTIPLDDISRWPPCMQNIWTLPSCGEGATRALADFVSFLGQIGLSEENARQMFSTVADRWCARTSNLFESYFRKMKTPTCARLGSNDNTGFPKGVSIKHLGVCVPDLKCMNAPSPYYYVDVKAKLRWKEEEKQAKAVKKPANEPFTCSQRVSV